MTTGLLLLDQAAIRRLIKSVECDLDIILYLGEWLTHLNMFSDAQIYGILKFVKSGICEFDTLARSGKVPVASLVVSDSRWITFTGKCDFIDVQTLEEIRELPRRAVTHIICDVTALWGRMHYRQERFHDRDSESATSDTDQASQLESTDKASGS